MKMQKTFRAADRESWRAWLAKNHASEREVWVVFPKRHTGERCMSYEDSVEEALCHGWIDSIIQRVDENSYARKFTPRTDHQNWSELNKRRIAKLIREGRMTEHGLAKIGYENPDQEPRKSEPKPLPLFMQQALKANPTAWENFNRRPPSHKKSYILWVLSAKREETRERRMKRVIQILVANKRLEIDAK